METKFNEIYEFALCIYIGFILGAIVSELITHYLFSNL